MGWTPTVGLENMEGDCGLGRKTMEMGRKKREAKATYCGDRVWGQESLLASVGSL